MSDVSEKLKEYNAAVDAEDAASEHVMQVLKELKGVAGGATFDVDGQYYQIRNRKGKTYLCELSGPPKGRPKKVVVAEVPEVIEEKVVDNTEA